MEPATIGVLARAGVSSATWAIRSLARSKDIVLSEPVVDLIVQIESADSANASDTLSLTHLQANDIANFLATPAVVSSIRISFLAMLAAEGARHDLADFVDGTNFAGLASHWMEGSQESWAGYIQEVWQCVNRQQQAIVIDLRARGLDDEMADMLVRQGIFGDVASDGRPEFLGVILEISRDRWRQNRLAVFLAECRRIDFNNRRETFQVHAGDQEARFDGLYVDRWLVDATTSSRVPAGNIVDPTTANSKVVVVGDPGVGKSTMTEWVKWQARQGGEDAKLVPVTIVCRNAMAKPGASIIDAISASISEFYLKELSPSEIEDLLSVGALYLVVDGIDEVLDLPARRRVVDQIKGLSSKYPLMSILCTTRRTGFEVGAFERSTFKVLSLEQYDDSQVLEYVTRWFSLDSGNIDPKRFLGESRALEDIRRNPLMLALLCMLFRQYDFIPQSRREVYTRCAALMFHEWDPRRGIDVPNIFKSRGEQILYTIAATLDRQGGIGESIDEDALQRLVAGELQESGIATVEATVASRELIEHCAGRAWILSGAPDGRGGRRFQFTHRTFFEFFAAEATIRSINRQNAVAPDVSYLERKSILSPASRSIVDAYRRDTTSVLPELLVQAADNLMGGIGHTLISEILKESRALARRYGSESSRGPSLTGLCVRLMAAVGGNRDIAMSVISASLTEWVDIDARGGAARLPRVSLTGLSPLLELPSGHREVLEELLDGDPLSAASFIRRYSLLDFQGEAGLYDSAWRDAAIRISPVETDDPIALIFEARIGRRSFRDVALSINGRELFEFSSGRGDSVFLDWLRSREGILISDADLAAHFTVEILSVGDDRFCRSWIEIALDRAVARHGVELPDCILVAVGVSNPELVTEIMPHGAGTYLKLSSRIRHLSDSYEDFYTMSDGRLVPISKRLERKFYSMASEILSESPLGGTDVRDFSLGVLRRAQTLLFG